MAAAEAADPVGKVIGVDVDQSVESETVFTSAVKRLSQSVSDTLATIYDGTFQGGSNVVLGAAENAVGLPMETSKFETFTQADYDALYAKLVSGEVSPLNYETAEKATDLTLEKTVVTLVE